MITLKRGDTSPLIKKVRVFLGLDDDSDEFDARLEFYVTWFQGTHNISTKRVIDAETYAAMEREYLSQEDARGNNSMVKDGVSVEVIEMEYAFIVARYAGQALQGALRQLELSLRRYTGLNSSIKDAEGRPLAMELGAVLELLNDAGQSEALIMQAHNYARVNLMEAYGIKQPSDDQMIDEYIRRQDDEQG